MNIYTKRCDIDPRVLDNVSRFLRQYGINEFFYGITTKVIPPYSHQFKNLKRRIPADMIKCRYGVYSSERVLRFRHLYLQYFAADDSAYFRPHPMGMSIWADPDYSGPKGQRFAELMAEHQFCSRGVWHLPTSYHPDWLCAFVYFSDLPREELLARLQPHEAEIETQLMMFASYFNEQFISQINPISNFNCLSERSLTILRLTAEGYSSEELAAKLCITESGVNYHLDRLKELLNAKNRVQLISMGYSLGLLS
ncbi:LuxR C-terminal-related transcriptional regulator [Shewanella schlegeliana]|uniref:LuxR family transcriptional regulator n=1 Tax=Shewanella schlegeliana TaxID=190308 RepID=A0ABS1SWA6_9GAMM|nr:helix-turn-helix transcriptional regulator [Shewanella schlegeliana]MBL4912825.1 LuxR family transcriptional regulator [Shewanella schlegeliana]MCL1109078.1 LuxR C-terminal-related transcriptional regulator [Shewanella schlegeliana]